MIINSTSNLLYLSKHYDYECIYSVFRYTRAGIYSLSTTSIKTMRYEEQPITFYGYSQLMKFNIEGIE